MIQNRVGSKSFLWHKQLNYDITAFSQIWINTYVNPEESRKCSYMFQNGKHALVCIFYATRSRNVCTDTLTTKAYSKIIFLAVIM